MLTEDEARGKVCPFISTTAIPNEDIGFVTGHAYCLASKCACWGWIDGEEGRECFETVWLPAGTKPGPDFEIQDYKDENGQRLYGWVRRFYRPRRGRCEAGLPR